MLNKLTQETLTVTKKYFVDFVHVFDEEQLIQFFVTGSFVVEQENDVYILPGTKLHFVKFVNAGNVAQYTVNNTNTVVSIYTGADYVQDFLDSVQ